MKLQSGHTSRGSTLTTTVVTTALIGTALGSFLGLISNRNQMSVRATAWNAAIPVLEAGIEEALTHLHHNLDRPTADGWQPEEVDGQTVYWKRSQDLPDGSYYCVTNFGFNSSSPVIRSAGFVRSPLQPREFIARVVEVTTTNPPSVFSRAIAAQGAVRLSGGAVVDGYDSALGPYHPDHNRNASGGIATNARQEKAIDVGSAILYGTAVTGPGGTVVVNGGSVGDLGWSGGIQEGWVGNDMNVDFKVNLPPAPTPDWQPVSPTAVGGSNITYLTSGTYKTENFVSNYKTSPMVVRGDVTLWVENSFTITGPLNNAGYVYIEPGASLKLYVGGTANISGGGIVNGTGQPTNLSFFGLPGTQDLIINGTANFVGMINAPQANFRLSGGGSVFGAVICHTFTSSGGSSVHYDQALHSEGRFLVNGWRELMAQQTP